MLVGLYWAITFFFVLPNNPLTIKAFEGKHFFQANLFQNWGFFAPPPNYDDKIYAICTDTITKEKDIIEFIEPILKAKHKQAPFNTYYQALDYLSSSLVTMTEDNIRQINSMLEYNNTKNAVKLTTEQIRDSIIIVVENSNEFKTVINYTKKILTDKKIALENKVLQIKITRCYFPQFIDRYNKNKSREEIIFAGRLKNAKS